jgi:hypothetical protein
LAVVRTVLDAKTGTSFKRTTTGRDRLPSARFSSRITRAGARQDHEREKMSQVTKGLILGSPGPAGSAAIVVLYGSGSPASNTDPNVSGARQGSLYIDYATPALYFKTSPTAWTQVAIP